MTTYLLGKAVMHVSPSKEKTCFKCRVMLPIDEFYRHPQMGDGHLNKCKICTRLDAQANRTNKLEYYREYDRSRGTRGRGVRDKYATRRSIEKSPLKRAAKNLTANAIREGRLVRMPCEVCGEEKVDAHHDDYSQPLSVRWLCRKHHAEHHKAERQKARERMKAGF